MRLRKPLSILLSLSMIAGMSAFASNAAVTSDESVSASNYYNANYLESYASKAYNESGLGSVYSKTSTTWKTWSPDASSVKLKLYTTGSDNEAGASAIGTYDMKKDSSTGVWSLNLSGDYKNKYYTYLVTVNGTTKETQDVYSQAVGVNGNRTMVVDLDSTDPSGWSDDKHVLFNSASEAAVWEVHVRDFSVSKNSGVSEDNKGKYLAFAEGGTTLNSDTSSSAVSTGIDYLVEQGINCVQLMPVYDYGSVKEDVASSSSNRNWGYDPVNYNAPEGSYSTNPYDGNTRITEFKQMIQALHDRGISVVMDVVYNHTFSNDSCFNRTVPGYYYRMHSSSAYSNGSGCGNETASDKLMYRKYMIESVKYWAEEYHIDGFRFDRFVHFSFAKDEQVNRIFMDGAGEVFRHVPNAYNLYQGIWIKHPAQNNLYPLSQKMKDAVVRDFLSRPTDIDSSQIQNYDQWLRLQFGHFFAEHFPIPYTKKYWMTEAKDLEDGWAAGKEAVYTSLPLKK